MKLRKIEPRDAERRGYEMYGYRPEMGRSSSIAVCPFCGTRNRVYMWSLAGGGKRCENGDCRAHLRVGFAIRDMVPAEGGAK